MNIEIWSKPMCPYCVSAKQLLQSNGFQFEEKILGIDFVKEELLNRVPDAKTFPQIFVNGHCIGGFTDLQRKISSLQEDVRMTNVFLTE